MNSIESFHQRLRFESATLVEQADALGREGTAAALRDGIDLLRERLSALGVRPITFAPKPVAPAQPLSVGAAVRIVEQAVADAAGCLPEMLHEMRRGFPEAARLRHAAIFFAYRLTEASTTHLARHYGLKDHTSVCYARDKVKGQIASGTFRGDAAALEARVRAALEAAGYRVPKARIAA